MTIASERPIEQRAVGAETHWRRWTMDMQIIVTDPDCIGLTRQCVDTELDAVEGAASRFQADSEINRLSRSTGRPTEVSQLLAELLAAALLAARQTDGDVDPTIGAALIALGYDRDFTAVDSSAPLAASVTIPAHWSMIQLENTTATVPPGIVIDLGATAKAVAADRCAAQAHHATGSGVLVNLGGDIATAGVEPQGGWQVTVQDGADEPATSVALSSGSAMATSSTVHRRWWRDRHAAHHIVDPRTGQSALPVWRTVSVAAQSCFAANTLSTAAIIRGWRALDWLDRQNIAARLVDPDRMVRTTGGWPADEDCRPR